MRKEYYDKVLLAIAIVVNVLAKIVIKNIPMLVSEQLELENSLKELDDILDYGIR